MSASLLLVYHDDAFSPGRTAIERSEEDHFLLRNLIQLSDLWLQTRSLRAQMTGEVRSSTTIHLAGRAEGSADHIHREFILNSSCCIGRLHWQVCKAISSRTR